MVLDQGRVMSAQPITLILSGEARTVVQAEPSWVATSPPTLFKKRVSGVGVGVFALVLAIHMGLFALLGTRTLTIASPEQATPGHGPLRVRLVSSKPEPTPPQPALQPPPPPAQPQPQPKPDKKVLSTEAPGQRVVEVAKPQPEPAPVAQAPAPAAVAPQPAAVPPPMVARAAADAPAGPVATAAKPDTLDLGSAPKQVGQIECRVPKPDYPRAARRRGDAGTVTIRLTVDERGQVSAAIERSSGFPDLDASARQAAQSAQCKPYLEGGRPIRVTALQPIHFVPAD